MGSLDYAIVQYAGGTTAIEGGFAGFNAVEIDQARVRIADSTFQNNAAGTGSDTDATRGGRGSNGSATIYVVGAQPVIINNTIQNNVGPAININVDSLTADLVDDWGRSTGFAYSPEQTGDVPATYIANMGPLVNGNLLANNGINGMLVRGGVINTQVVFDDTDIVYVVEDEITSPDVSTVGGLRIESSATQSLVVKLLGATAGFTATGETGDISDRIGGFVDIVGTPNHPVILTSLNDNTVGAGFMPNGSPDLETGNNPSAVAAPGDWRSVKIDEYSNDNNFLVVNGYQQNTSASPQQNLTPATAQYIGQLAPNTSSGDDQSRQGFEIHGTLAQASNVDVYSFTGTAGTQVYFQIDNTSFALGTVLELVDAKGSVVAQVYSVFNAVTQTYSLQYVGLAQPVDTSDFTPPDWYAINNRDVGMSVILPSSGSTTGVNTYYVRVRSEPQNLANLNNLSGGAGTGDYQLQIRLSDEYQFPGSEVQYADISYATNGVEVLGQPASSPLIGDTVSVGTNNTFATAQDLGNLLNSSQTQISVAGNLTSVDWYKFELNYQLVQSIAGNNAELTWPAVFKVSYAEGLVGPETTLALYDSNGNLLMIGRNSDVADNEPPDPDESADTSDLSHGSFGADPFIGTVQLQTANTYYLAVMPANEVPSVLDQTYSATATSPLTRIEPIDSVARVAEDHVGNSDESSTATDAQTLDLTPTAYNLGNVVMYVNSTGALYTVDPFTGAEETTVGGPGASLAGTPGDIAMRNDGELYTFTNGNNDAADNYAQINTGSAAETIINNDGIVTTDVPPGTTAAAAQNVGLTINAMAFVQDPVDTNRSLYGIGSRPAGPGVNETTNLLYQFDPNAGTVKGTVSNPLGTPTNVPPIGQVLTGYTIGFNNPATPTLATTDNPANDIVDGQTITIDGQTFEFDSGPDINIDPKGGLNTRDEQTFKINGTTFEFDSGPVLSVVGNGTQFQQGDTISLTDSSGNGHVFEFVNSAGTTPVIPGDIAIDYQPTFSQAAMVGAIVSAINGAGFSLHAALPAVGSTRITLTGDEFPISVNSSLGGVVQSGDYGVTPGNVAVPFEETDSQAQIGAELVTAINGANINVTASYANGRITIAGAQLSTSSFPLQNLPTVDTPFISLNNNVITGTPADSGVAVAGDLPVVFGAADSATQLATELAAAINADTALGVTATVTGSEVALTGVSGTVTHSTPVPFVFAGAGPGGTITGMADLNGTMYAVSSLGGFYSVSLGGTSNALGNLATYIATIASDSGKDIPFSGLSDGPPDVESGAYANTLFATDSNGNIWALNASGTLQHIFTNGADNVSTGLGALTGVAFSTLDYNLWHETSIQSAAPGHGVNPSPDDGTARNTAPLVNSSYYFGLDNPNIKPQESSQPGLAAYASNSSLYNTTNLPGGAYGSLTTGTFSLAGYSSSDDPTLYFNYFLSSLGDNTLMNMTDSFRVFVSDDGANWNEIATNNLVLSTAKVPAELPTYISTFGGTYEGDAADQNTQELFPNSNTWREARIDLGDYAGDTNLQLRFDYSSAGSMAVGNAMLTGSVIEPPAGSQITSGDYFAVNNQNFTFNLGTVFDAMDAGDITSGTAFTVTGPSGTATFQLLTGGAGASAGNIAVPINTTDSADTVAQDILNAVDGAGIGYDTSNSYISDDRIEFVGGSGSVGAGSGLTLEPTTTGGIAVNFSTPAATVAQELANAINTALVPAADVVPGVLTAVKLEGDTINVINNTITGSSSDLSTYISSSLPGDQYGNINNAGRNTNNNFQGAFIDDLIVGLAGRGEMVTDPTANTTFYTEPANPDPMAEKHLYTGTYQLEIQRGSEYATQTSQTKPGITLTQQFSINDRLTQAISLMAASGDEIGDNTTFQVSDGYHTPTTFQFTTSGSTTNAAYFPVVYSVDDSATDVADDIADAINSDTANLNVTAGVVGYQVNLFGAAKASSSNGVQVQAGSAVVDGETFTLTTPEGTQTFEFETSGVPDISGAIAIQYLSTDTAAQMATLMANAINNSSLGDIATASGGTLSVADAQVTYNYFTALAGSTITELSTFQLTSNTSSVTYQYALTPADLDEGDVGLIYQANYTANDMASLIAGGIDLEGPDVTAISQGDVVILSGPATVSGNGVVAPGASTVSGATAVVYDMNQTNGFPLQGDTLSPGLQGYTLVTANKISDSLDYGISVGPGARIVATNSAPGPVRNLPTANTADLVPGISLENNLLVGNIAGGIQISGDPNGGPEPFVHVVNNTIYGATTTTTTTTTTPTGTTTTTTTGPAGIGINVINSASPTLLNNIIANTATGIAVDGTSGTTVVGYDLFQGNTTNGVTGTNAIALSPSAPLFVDAANDDFYLAAGSAAIGSSLNSMLDRPAMTAVDQPLGIPPLPIIAPAYDLYGVLRQNSGSTGTGGQGQNVFIDRGAIQRADTSDPTAALTTPNAGGATSVTLVAQTTTQFTIQLSDGNGSGIDSSTVTAAQFTITFNGSTITSPNSYTFNYDPTNNLVTLTAAAGVFADGTYVITLNNSSSGGIKDLAGNPLQPNNSTTGATTFTINLLATAPADGWKNPNGPFDAQGDSVDVNGDGQVNPLDALVLINALNLDLFPGGLLPAAPSSPADYYDVNGDGYLTPIDVLLVINYLNTHVPGTSSLAVATTTTAEPAASQFDSDSGSSSAVVSPTVSTAVASPVTSAAASNSTPATPAITTLTSSIASPATSVATSSIATTNAASTNGNGSTSIAVTPAGGMTSVSLFASSNAAVQQAAQVAGGTTARGTRGSPAAVSAQALSSILTSSRWQQHEDALDDVLADIAPSVHSSLSQNKSSKRSI